MGIFTTTLSQMAFLFSLILLGYLLAKRKIVPQNASVVLSKLENTLFIPCLVAGTFIQNFTVERISEAKELMLVSVALCVVAIPVGILLSKLFGKDRYTRNIYTYGLVFSNFGFMGMQSSAPYSRRSFSSTSCSRCRSGRPFTCGACRYC